MSDSKTVLGKDSEYVQQLLSGCAATLKLPRDLRDSIGTVYEIGRRFFELPEEEREANPLSFGCGYCPYGIEHSGVPSDPDRVDSFKASVRTIKEVDALPTPEARLLHQRMMEAFTGFEALAEALMASLAARLGHPPDPAFRGGLHRWSQIQLNRSRPTAAGRLTHREHEDGHFLTFVHSTVPGLEVSSSGRYAPASIDPGTVTAMPGELARLLSGGRLQPTYHRVRAVRTKEPRLSLLFFADLDPALCSAWIESPENDGVNFGDHVLRNSSRFGVPSFSLEAAAKKRITQNYATY